MSINSIASAEIYSAELDRVFEAKSATAFFADNALRTRFVGAKTVIIPDVEFEGLTNYDRAGGFSNGAVTVSNTSYTMSMDRARSLQIDREDMDETGIASLAGKILGEYVRTKVIPECDAYVMSKLGGIAKAKGNLVKGNLDKPFETFTNLVNQVQSVAGYDSELVCFVDSAAYAALMSSDELTRMITVSDFKQGEVNLKVKSINGVAIIPVVSERMKTAYNFTNGGFKPADNASEIFMLVLPKTAAHLVKKTEKMRIFTPEQNANADAYKFDYRIYYDVFVKASASDSVWAWISSPVTIVSQPEDLVVEEGIITEKLSVVATTDDDSSITYQWYKCDTKTGKGAAKIENAQNSEYALSNSLEEGEFYFFCKVTVDGTHTVSTDIATVIVE
ncbi:MAG: hypothetical protein E7540_03310 [Ruminococcaceae bacterium]|nr:hypothetical protein [Oscillospiraceae bacterium]